MSEQEGGKNMDYKQARMLKAATITLIIWSIVRGTLTSLVFMMDIYEIRPDGIMMIEGFHSVHERYLVALHSWERIIRELLLFYLGVAADLIAGIAGAANWRKPERAKRCFLWGAVAIIANVTMMFLLEPTAGIGSLAIHIWYIAGAWQLKGEEQNTPLA